MVYNIKRINITRIEQLQKVVGVGFFSEYFGEFFPCDVKNISVFPFWNCILNLINLLNYFATGISTFAIQLLISTGVLTFSVQVYISKLKQVQNYYLYLLKKKTYI